MKADKMTQMLMPIGGVRTVSMTLQQSASQGDCALESVGIPGANGMYSPA